jgi:hypothetical protein
LRNERIFGPIKDDPAILDHGESIRALIERGRSMTHDEATELALQIV